MTCSSFDLNYCEFLEQSQTKLILHRYLPPRPHYASGPNCETIVRITLQSLFSEATIPAARSALNQNFQQSFSDPIGVRVRPFLSGAQSSCSAALQLPL